MKKTLLLLLLFTSFYSCKKGDTGTPGTNGKDGNANVHSRIISATGWAKYITYWYVNIPDSTITIDMFNKGNVDVYVNQNGYLTNLPTEFITGDTYIAYSYTVGSIKVIVYNTDGNVAPYPGTVTLKIVTTEGN